MKTNIKAFKKLILRYESITLEEIRDAHFFDDPLAILTGFGNGRLCTLCLEAGKILNVSGLDSFSQSCPACIWDKTKKVVPCYWYPCNSGINEKTYKQIEDFKTPLGLLKAYRSRAKHMRSVLDTLKLKQP